MTDLMTMIELARRVVEGKPLPVGSVTQRELALARTVLYLAETLRVEPPLDAGKGK